MGNSPQDIVAIMRRAARMGIPLERVAAALEMDGAALREIEAELAGASTQSVPLTPLRG